MDVSVLITWSTEFRQTAWSIGHCPSCDSTSAIRIEDVLSVMWVYFFRATEDKIGETNRCDFCERWVDALFTSQVLAIDGWKSDDGLTSLGQKLGLGESFADQVDPTRRLVSLLAAVDEDTAPHRIDITFGLTTGLVLGGVLGAPVGYFVLSRWLWRMDTLGHIFAGILGGLVLGAVLGSVAWVVWQQFRLPLRKLCDAHRRYLFDCKRLRALSHDRSWRVRRATRLLDEGVYLNHWAWQSRKAE